MSAQIRHWCTREDLLDWTKADISLKDYDVGFVLIAVIQRAELLLDKSMSPVEISPCSIRRKSSGSKGPKVTPRQSTRNFWFPDFVPTSCLTDDGPKRAGRECALLSDI